jgi:hypothetical protein
LEKLAPTKDEVFHLDTWLATKGRIWTADRRLRRHDLEAHDLCWLCDQEKRTRHRPVHLFVSCSFAKEVWWGILSWFGCTCNFADGELQDWWVHLRKLQPRS